MQWTDRIRQVKILLVVAAVVIAVLSLVVSHLLTRDLSDEERSKMEVWSEAMRALNQADENTDLALVLKVIDQNHTIPVVVMGADGQAQFFRNVNVDGDNYEDSLRNAQQLGQQWLNNKQHIRIQLSDSTAGDYIDVCYDDSVMLRRLQTYPFVQLGVVMIFVVVAIFALLTSKRAEQNKVMDKDVKRLQLIADRFSKIGSLPEPVPASLNEVMNHVIDYMDRRTSKKVNIVKNFTEDDIIVSMNASLFEWVIENLCKNAVDAMSGEPGTITLSMERTATKAIIEVSDTGKGIRKKDISNVFRPGFTTKKRGWGLGLSLAKRIVEEYHKGHIFVKSSEPGRGTTFRIELPLG